MAKQDVEPDSAEAESAGDDVPDVEEVQNGVVEEGLSPVRVKGVGAEALEFDGNEQEVGESALRGGYARSASFVGTAEYVAPEVASRHPCFSVSPSLCRSLVVPLCVCACVWLLCVPKNPSVCVSSCV